MDIYLKYDLALDTPSYKLQYLRLLPAFLTLSSPSKTIYLLSDPNQQESSLLSASTTSSVASSTTESLKIICYEKLSA